MQSGWQKLETPKQKEALRRFSANASRAQTASRGGGRLLQVAALRRLATVHGILVIAERTSEDNPLMVDFSVIAPVKEGVAAALTIHPKQSAVNVPGADEDWVPFEYTAETGGVPYKAYAQVTGDNTFFGERLIDVPAKEVQMDLVEVGP